jgi:hypothetical protein
MVFWDGIPHNLIDRHHPFGGTCRLFVHSTLKMEAAYSSETLLPVYYWTAWCYVPEDCNLDNSTL